jgi:transcriptional regulator
MYIPSSFAETDLPTLLAFLEAHPLAALVTGSAPTGLFATHLPLVADCTAAPMRLVGHIARANQHARQLALGGADALVIFTGPDAYITPEWYASKEEHGRVVPTWNYVAVHAYGSVSLRDDPAFLRQHLEMLTSRHQAERGGAWQVGDAPEEFIAQQMKAIVGIEVEVARLEGKWKMSQNRTGADVDGVVRGLSASDAPADRAVAAIVAERRSPSR